VAGAMNASVYDLKDITVDYGGRRVLELDELSIREGEVQIVLGPNGAGKSTLLRLLNLLEAPGSGRIAYRGRPVAFPAPLELRREITTVFQHPILLKRSTWDNVVFGLRLRGQRPDGSLTTLVCQLDLERLLYTPAERLSGGEAQRVALARALAIRPKVLLLDEPSANLDPYSAGLVEKMVLGLRSERNTTIVLVTHNVFQARRLADRVVMLLGGRIVEAAETERFFESPRDPRTAAFVRGELVY
jgi:tungstate transport system ATP-binding protein